MSEPRLVVPADLGALGAAELATLEGRLDEVLTEVRRRMSEERLGEFPPGASTVWRPFSSVDPGAQR